MSQGCQQAFNYTIKGGLAVAFLFVGMTLARILFGGLADMMFVLFVLFGVLSYRIFKSYYQPASKPKRKEQ